MSLRGHESPVLGGSRASSASSCSWVWSVPSSSTTSPTATVGGLYDAPQGFGPLILGTDNQGQSVIANLVYGTRTSLIVGFIAGVIGTAIGLLVGLVSGYRGGLTRRHPERHRERRPGHPGHRGRHPGLGVAAAAQPLHPGAGDRLHRLVLARQGRAGADHERANPRAHRRGQAVRSRLLVDPAPRHPALPAVVRRDGRHPADLRRHLVRVHAEHARAGPVQCDQPRHHAVLGHPVGRDPDRRLVGVLPADASC